MDAFSVRTKIMIGGGTVSYTHLDVYKRQGLLGGVLNDSQAVGQHGRQHDVHGGAHRDDVQIDLGAAHAAVFGLGMDVAAPHIHVGPHGHKALDVLVNGPSAEVTATRRCVSETGSD